MGIIGGILLVAGLIWTALFIVAKFREFEGGNNAFGGRGSKENIAQPRLSLWHLVGGLGTIILAIFLWTSFTTIAPGHNGVILWFNSVENRTLDSGLVFKVPFVEEVIPIDVRVQTHEFKSIDAASKEMQAVSMTGNVNWHFDPLYLNWIYANVGANKDFVDKILDKSLQDFMKEVTPQYSIVDILPSRSAIRDKAVAALGQNLSRYHIVINDIYLSDISFSPEYMAAIEKQQVAQRQVGTEQNILQTKQIVAQQAKVEAGGLADAAIARAEGDKQAAILKSQGEAQAILTVAQSQADANNKLSNSITKNIIDYTYVQKLAPGVKTIILPNGQQFILSDSIMADK